MDQQVTRSLSLTCKGDSTQPFVYGDRASQTLVEIDMHWGKTNMASRNEPQAG
jgi:hypothetical protein